MSEEYTEVSYDEESFIEETVYDLDDAASLYTEVTYMTSGSQFFDYDIDNEPDEDTEGFDGRESMQRAMENAKRQASDEEEARRKSMLKARENAMLVLKAEEEKERKRMEENEKEGEKLATLDEHRIQSEGETDLIDSKKGEEFELENSRKAEAIESIRKAAKEGEKTTISSPVVERRRQAAKEELARANLEQQRLAQEEKEKQREQKALAEKQEEKRKQEEREKRGQQRLDLDERHQEEEKVEEGKQQQQTIQQNNHEQPRSPQPTNVTTPKHDNTKDDDDVGGEYYSIEEMQTKSIAGLDYPNREKYLSPEDFQTVFGATREVVAKWPKWKITQKKRKAKLW